MEYFLPTLLILGYVTFLPLIFIPTVRAFRAGHPHRWYCLWANILLGWNIVGWICLLSWSDRIRR